MKKIRLFIISLLLIIILSGCKVTSCDGLFGNETQMDLTKTYNYIYVKVSYDDTWEKYHIQQWCEYDDNAVQVELDDGTIILFTNVPYILVRGNGFEFDFENNN